MIAWTDEWQAYASIASVLVSLGSTVFVVVSIRQASSAIFAQNRSNDIATVLSIWEKLDEHWNRFRTADEKDKNFEFGQLIGYYEMSCRLFRDAIFTTKAAWTLYEHLHEVLTSMQRHSDFKLLFENLRSRPETFENIKWLCAQPAEMQRESRKNGKSWLGRNWSRGRYAS